MANTIIGIADLAVAQGANTLTTLGLGSCVGLVLYDKHTKIGGMAHIMLPEAPGNVEQKHKAKYADTAFTELMRLVLKAGATKSMLVAKLAGGAHMFSSSVGNDVMKVGQRNVDMCHSILRQNSLRIAAEEVGGTIGRTITFDCESGLLLIKTAWPKTEKTI